MVILRLQIKNMQSWLPVDKNSDFSMFNIPFGVFKTEGSSARVGTRIGNTVIDLSVLADNGFLDETGIKKSVFKRSSLNPFIKEGKTLTNAVRNHIIHLFSKDNETLFSDEKLRKKLLIDASTVKMLLPVKIGDYTDFYSSIDHATNVGKMFRDPENALLPNWKHLPVGYHGRSSSIIVSGTSFNRPKGQTKPADSDKPVFGPSKLLDFELEMGFIIGKKTKLGNSVTTKKADKYIFGFVLFNDWSARDIQTWEYVPLGPFLAKNFASSMSPWVVTIEALEPFRVKGYDQIPEVLPYLKYSGEKNIDINLEVAIEPAGVEESVVAKSNYRYMYWTAEQQLAHHTVNGCNINVGDLMASGTISGPEESSFGSMLEITWRGTKPVKMKDGSERKFINDGDTVIMRGYALKDGMRVGFGEVMTKVLPAKDGK
jgi:fumarylacetoacetase